MENSLSNIKMYQLSNGITCYIHSQPDREGSTMVCLSVKAGSTNEREGEKGWFHFLEHLSIYIPLYNYGEENLAKMYFRAFDYAYTSFGETAYFFKGMDSTKSLLKNNLVTAKGILEGTFLLKTSFLQTKEDVLNEYCAFQSKAWYSSCVEIMNNNGITMPVGRQEDILSADYEKLIKLHKEYYKPQNAAVIISTPHEAAAVYDIVDDIFNKKKIDTSYFKEIYKSNNPFKQNKQKISAEDDDKKYVMLAWLSRIGGDSYKTLENYMFLAVLARGIELILAENERIKEIECDVEIFSNEKYIFKIRLSGEAGINKIADSLVMTKPLFEKAKEIVRTQLHEQYVEENMQEYAGNAVNCCREHFLYREPIIDEEGECEICYQFLNSLNYSKIKKAMEEIKKQLLFYQKEMD